MEDKYIFPDVDFLKYNSENVGTQNEDGDNLISFLKIFKVSAKIAYIEKSAVSNLYALELAPGVRVSKVTGLKHELSVELNAIDIQFVIPIPGTSYLGIRAIKPDAPEVLLGNFLRNDSYLKYDNCMEVVLGRTYDGKPAYFDFRKLTHLLISGTTGSGKSIFIDSIIVNLLYKASPDELKLVLIDTHALNLLRFNNLPHLRFPVVTDCKKASAALAWAVAEMDNRYKELSNNGVKNIAAYNALMKELGQKGFPEILVVIDDLADVMSECSYPNEIQTDLDRLTSMARSAGIHLLLSIQRPSSEIVSNTVKMNIPNRIAFRTVSGNDSRLIIQTSGAECLNGNGDMLFKLLGQQDPLRIQGPYVSDEEIDYVVKFVIRNNSCYANNDKAFIEYSKDRKSEERGSYDMLLIKAGEAIIAKQMASPGMLMRVFKIGYNRAVLILKQLDEIGVVSFEEDHLSAKILVDMEEFERISSKYLPKR